jgi:hypothetical protein
MANVNYIDSEKLIFDVSENKLNMSTKDPELAKL